HAVRQAHEPSTESSLRNTDAVTETTQTVDIDPRIGRLRAQGLFGDYGIDPDQRGADNSSRDLFGMHECGRSMSIRLCRDWSFVIRRAALGHNRRMTRK